MLSSYSPHRGTPSISPNFQHAPKSNSRPGSPQSRRSSGSRIANPTPLQRPQYVDAATQWSPIIITKMKPPVRASATSTTVPQDAKGAERSLAAISPSVPNVAKTPSSTKPLDPPESPGMKRRQEEAPVVAATSAIPTSSSRSEVVQKRLRSDQTQVKILPLRYEFCPVEDMVVLIATMIQELINTNDSLPLRSGVLTRFHSRTPPGISVQDYLQRLAKHATLTPPILLSMVYYIDRLCLLYPAFTVTSLTVHRFLITAATVAAKGLSDSFWTNSTYARVGGVKVTELGLLELEFLYRVDWKIVPNPEALVDYYKGLIERKSGYELEVNSSDIEDDEDGDDEQEDSDMKDEDETKGKGGTDLKWKAWMDDVSSQKMDGASEDNGGKDSV